jgi:L-malate glycosyltransferase
MPVGLRKLGSNKIRIGHLIYSQEIGGSEIVASNICSVMDREVFEPIILFLYNRPGPMPQILDEKKIHHRCIQMSKWRRLFRPFFIAFALNQLKIDILHIHHLNFYRQVIFGARLSRVKGLVFTEHSYRELSNNHKLQSVFNNAVNTVDHCTVITNKMKDFFVSRLNIKERQLRVIYNGVDCIYYSPENEYAKPSTFPPQFKGKILLSAGRLVEEKDHFTLLESLRILFDKGHDILLLVVGDGYLRDSICKKIDDLGLNNKVIMVGTRSNIADYLYYSDIFVLSSKSEGLPMVILEAMASGTPVVSTTVGGIPEIIKNEKTGLLVPPQNPVLFASAIERLLIDSELSKQISDEARRLMLEKFDLRRITEEYCQLYKNIMKAYLNPSADSIR